MKEPVCFCVWFRNMYCVWRAYLEGTVQVTQSRISTCDNYKVQVADPAKTARLQKEQQLRKVLKVKLWLCSGFTCLFPFYSHKHAPSSTDVIQREVGLTLTWTRQFLKQDSDIVLDSVPLKTFAALTDPWHQMLSGGQMSQIWAQCSTGTTFVSVLSVQSHKPVSALKWTSY